jgi:hypothetical protein
MGSCKCPPLLASVRVSGLSKRFLSGSFAKKMGPIQIEHGF